MDPEILRWILAIHVYAILTWIGSLVGLTFMLKQHAQAAESARDDFLKLEKGTAIAADIGATIAIIAGLVMIIDVPQLLKEQAWMHPKLALVGLVLGIHGYQRARLGKFKRGNVSANPAWVIPVLEIAVVGIIALAVAKPF